jgi:hypothetical protein
MPNPKCLLIVLVISTAASSAFAEAGRAQRDVALQALQLSDGIALNTARKGSVPAGLPPGVYPNREREGRVVCVRERVQSFGATNPAHVEIVTVCTR